MTFLIIYFKITYLAIVFLFFHFIELSPQNTHNYILEPNVLTLECSLKTPNATWYKDSVKLHNNSNGYIMKSFGNNPWVHSLTKTNTSVNDTGKYRCATAAKSFSYNVVIFKGKFQY